jgi:hypothetical protein
LLDLIVTQLYLYRVCLILIAAQLYLYRVCLILIVPQCKCQSAILSFLVMNRWPASKKKVMNQWQYARCNVSGSTDVKIAQISSTAMTRRTCGNSVVKVLIS